ncbi:MAG TPA: glutathione transferase GstA [Rhizomicrobium sp.]
MKLYFSPGTCSLASRIVAEEEGLALDYEKIDIDRHRTGDGRDYYALNPKGTVPALVLEDGSLLTENVAVLQFLGDQKPKEGLVPRCGTLERVRLQEWLGFLASEVHKGFEVLFHGDEAQKAEGRVRMGKLLRLIEDRLAPGGYLMGDRFGVADAYLYVMLRWTHATHVDLTGLDKLEALRDRVAERESVKRAHKAEGLRPPFNPPPAPAAG